MANVIYIQIVEGDVSTTKVTTKATKDVMVFPLMEDLQMDVRSELGSFADMFPSLESVLTTVTSYVAGASGKAGEGLMNLNNMFSVPRWTGTKPIKFTLKLPFYTINDARDDVYDPMIKLMALTILTTNTKTKQFSVPGIFAGALKQTTKQSNTTNADTKGWKQSAKLVSIKIPGIIYMPLALIESAQPTFSKHLTESGYPLWGILDTTFVGLYPATDDMFNAGFENQIKVSPK